MQSSETTPATISKAAGGQTRTWWRDALIVLILFVGAVPIRWGHTRGDLWSDEADYALASTHGFAANRMDRSDRANDPDRLVRSRHFHPPMTVYLLDAAQGIGKSDRVLRVPFVIAGSLVVCLTYLCGLLLFEGRRDISLFCALVVLVTPLQIRAASHAIPWSLISLGLLCVVYTLLGYIRHGKAGWLIGTGGVLSLLFCVSESVFPIALAVGLSLPFVLKRDDVQTIDGRRALAKALMAGAVLAAILIAVLWPAGVVGGAWRNIQHYAHIPEMSASAQVGGVLRTPIPKWAYLYWYTHDYRPYAALYALGVIAVVAQMARRRLERGPGVLLVFTVVEIGVAHLAIEFGPQYLAHCLPLLTLMTGYFLLQASRFVQRRVEETAGAKASQGGRIAFGAAMMLIVAYLAHWHVRADLRETDATALVSRWPDASGFLAARWQPGDRLMIGPQPVVVPRWYLRHYLGLALADAQITELPQGRTRQVGLERLAKDAVRFVVVNSTFENDPAIDGGVRKIIADWPLVYQSREPDGSPPHLVIYERPASQNPAFYMPGS